MKDEPTPQDDGKTPHERFLALGKRVLAVPRTQVSALDKKWHQKKRIKKRAAR